jgi:integrase
MRRGVRDDGVKLPNVHRVTARERVYKFHRVTRAKLPTDIPETDPRFVAAWSAEEAKAPARATPGTLTATIQAYLKSADHKGLSADYRRSIAAHAMTLAELYGTVPARAIRQYHVERDLAKLDAHPAVHRWKTWRRLGKFIKDQGIGPIDPTYGIPKPKTARTEGFKPWTADQVAAFRAHWPIGTMQRKAFEFLHWTAMRTIDAVRVGRANLTRDGLLTYRQNKTSNLAHVPWSCPLPAWAPWHDERDQVIAAVNAVPFDLLFLETAYGKSRSHKGLSNLISDAASEAGIDRSAHGLRKSRLQWIAEAGGSVHSIMSWGGHVTLSEAQHYISAAERKWAVMGREQVENGVKQPENSCKTKKNF